MFKKITSLMLMTVLLISMSITNPEIVSAKDNEIMTEPEAVLPVDGTEAAAPYIRISNRAVFCYMTMGTSRQIAYETNCTNLKFSSSNKSACAVDSKGLVTPKKVRLGGYEDPQVIYISVTGTGPNGVSITEKIRIEEIYFSDLAQLKNQNRPFCFYPVYWAVSKGIASGYKNADGSLTGKFRPDHRCTRGEVVTFLYRAAGSPSVNTTTVTKFKDVKSTDFFYTAVCWAVSKGITTGYLDWNGKPTGYFGPNDVCTRGQVMTFMYRAAGSPAISTNLSMTYSDVKKSDYFYKPVLWATMNNITTGYSGTQKFGPNDQCTRGQVVTFIWRKAGSPMPGTIN